jgi:hypothetical protein
LHRAADRQRHRHADRSKKLINFRGGELLVGLRSSTRRWRIFQNWRRGHVRTTPATAEDGTTRCSTESLTFDSLAGGYSPQLSRIAIRLEADGGRNICGGVDAIRTRSLRDGDVRRPDLGLIGYGFRFVLQHLIDQNQHDWEE